MLSKRIAATAAAFAFAGLSAGAGVATAGDEVLVDGSYSTVAACQTDGPEVQIAQDNDRYSNWECREGDDGLYYLYLTN
jgi:hypothetical protein